METLTNWVKDFPYLLIWLFLHVGIVVLSLGAVYLVVALIVNLAVGYEFLPMVKE